MKITFYKYNGAGNDFVMLDNREGWFDWNDHELIAYVCDRKFGVGADGILLLQNKDGYAFEMLYANSDGSRGSMCGNGGRCIVHFAHKLDLIEQDKEIEFLGPDGSHAAVLHADGQVALKMKDNVVVTEREGLSFVDTGTPHYIQHVVNLDEFPVNTEARKFRDRCNAAGGVNVNYVEHDNNGWHVRTYERGVEDETLACGTGATAVAIELAEHKNATSPVDIHMPGGILNISFEKKGDTYLNIWLTGPATFVFEGEIEV